MLSEKTTFTMGLGRLITIIVAIVGMAFTVGMTYQQMLPDRELQKKQTQEIEDIKLTLSRVTTILENMEKRQSDTTRDLSALQNRTHVMNAELQLISSSIREKNRRN